MSDDEDVPELNDAFVLGWNLTHVVKPAAEATMWNTNTRHTCS